LTFLVTGGAGFIGSHLVGELVKRGDRVVIFDRVAPPTINYIRNVVVVQGDIRDIFEILDVIKRYDVKIIIHLASLLIPESQENPFKAFKINCEGALNIFEVARIVDKKVKRVIYASSGAVYGPAEYYGNKPVNEDAPIRPLNVYGMCKAFVEWMGGHYYNSYKLDNIGLRFALVYGPGRIRGATAFVNELIVNPALGKPAKVPYGAQKFNWLYIKDAVKAILLACEVERTRHRVFNIGGDIRTVYEVAEYVKRLIPNAVIECEPGALGWQMEFDITRAKEELGYMPTYTIERGVRETINIIRAQMGLPSLET